MTAPTHNPQQHSAINWMNLRIRHNLLGITGNTRTPEGNILHPHPPLHSQPQRQNMLHLAASPKPVFQDDFSPAKGNSLQACVASLFDQSLKDVPNFLTLECGYEAGIQNYVSHHGYRSVKKKIADVSREDEGRLCILRGKSPRGNFGHVVVGRVGQGGAFEMAHDPHPDGQFLDKNEAYGWCMLFYVKGST